MERQETQKRDAFRHASEGDNLRIRHKLAIAYRTLGKLALDDLTYTHLSARDVEGDGYFIYPFGLCFQEVTAENLLHVSLEGEIKSGSEWQYNKTGYMIHGSIYKARDDLHAIFHLHTPEIIAVSAHKQGLMPFSQWALHFYEQVAYHDYGSLVLEAQQGEGLLQDLGSKKVMFLRNHGSLQCGRTIHEAMFYTWHLWKACQTQVMLYPVLQDCVMPKPSVCASTVEDLLGFEADLGARDFAAWERLDTQML